MSDFRYAARLFVSRPMFACLVVGTLTLGIAASTSMFSVVNGVLLRPLPYPDAASLVWLFGAFRSSDSAAVSPPDFVDYRRHNDVFERFGAMAISPEGVTMLGGAAPLRLQASLVSAELITTLGVPILGRDFTRADESGGSTAVIVSYRLWHDLMAGDSGVLGRSIAVDNRLLTIVGVMPAGFTLPYDSFIRLTEPVDLYFPLALDDPDSQIRRFHSLRLIGRLKPGVSLERAQSQMDVVARQLAASYPENDTWHLRLVPLHEKIVGAVRPVLMILMGAVALLLLVACANVATLLLARLSAREHELVLRGALGASRARIVRQLLVEGLVLSFAGGTAGLIVTWWAIQALKLVGPTHFPRLETIGFEPRVVVFAFAMAAVTTVLFALVPAIHAARGDIAAVMRRGHSATADWPRRLGQRMLVVAQLSVSFVLLAGAALLVRGFLHLIAVDIGFDPAAVTLTRLPLPVERYDTAAKIDTYYSALLDRLRSTPDIAAAALATAPPLAGANDAGVHRQGHPPATERERRFVQIRRIQGDYFQTLNILLIAGRSFSEQIDRAGSPDVAVISRRTARDYFSDEDAIGHQLVVDVGKPLTVTVVGIVGDVRTFGRASEAPPMLYLHARQHPVPYMQVLVKATAPAIDVASTIRQHVVVLDATLAPSRTERMETLMADSVAQPRFAMLLIGSFAAMALLLALVGLYGTLAYLVSQRRREIGIRLAVGATRRDIRRMVFRQGAALVGIGIPIGLLLSLFTSRLAAAVFVDLRPADPLVLASVAGLVVVAAFAAVLVPSVRAARVEALVALRVD